SSSCSVPRRCCGCAAVTAPSSSARPIVRAHLPPAPRRSWLPPLPPCAAPASRQSSTSIPRASRFHRYGRGGAERWLGGRSRPLYGPRRAAPRRALSLRRLQEEVGQHLHDLRAVAARGVRSNRRVRHLRQRQLLPPMRVAAVPPR